MPVKGKVNIKWQIILTLLPITAFSLGAFWASYRIKKLRKFFALFLILYFIGFSFGLLNPPDPQLFNEFYDNNSVTYELSLYLNPFHAYFLPYESTSQLIVIFLLIASYIVVVFFIYRWSTEWNKQFTNYDNGFK